MTRPQFVPTAEVVKVPSPLLTTKELGAYLKCAVATAEKWRARGNGPPHIRTPYGIRYRVADVDVWLAENSEPGGRMESKRRAPSTWMPQ